MLISRCNLFWIEESGPDKRQWAIIHAMYACKFFPETKAADHIQVALDRILIEAGLEAENVPCTTDKGANMVAASVTLIVHATICPPLSIQDGKGLVGRALNCTH